MADSGKMITCLAKPDGVYDGKQDRDAVESDMKGKWPNGVITYSLTKGTEDIEGDKLEAKAINWAFLVWGIRIKNIKFKRIRSGTADIMIRFAPAGTDQYFTSESILAYAWYPNVSSPLAGDIVFNDMPKINWSLDGLGKDYIRPEDGVTIRVKTINLRQVACHEIGHALGLSHSVNCENCMMYPYYRNNLLLGELDTTRIQDIYGKRLIQSRFIDSINTLLGRGIMR